MTSLKWFGRWKSSDVAEGHIEDYLNNKIQMANTIFTAEDIPKNQSNFPPVLNESDIHCQQTTFPM